MSFRVVPHNHQQSILTWEPQLEPHYPQEARIAEPPHFDLENRQDFWQELPGMPIRGNRLTEIGTIIIHIFTVDLPNSPFGLTHSKFRIGTVKCDYVDWTRSFTDENCMEGYEMLELMLNHEPRLTT